MLPLSWRHRQKSICHKKAAACGQPLGFSCFQPLPTQNLFEDSLEGAQRLRANQRPSVDQEGRGAAHANPLRHLGLVLHQLCVAARIQAFVKDFGVQANLFCKALQILFAESALVFAGLAGKQLVVVLPKSILFSGAFGCFGSPKRFLA